MKSRAEAAGISCMFRFILVLAFLFRIGGASSDDLVALLAFKRAIKSDPLNILSTWNSNDDSPCTWAGVGCDSGRVVSLNISGLSSGRCRDAIASRNSFENIRSQGLGLAASVCHHNASVIEQVQCRLKGSLAPEIGNLTQLQALILSFNQLSGEIPKEISNLRYLEVLDLQQNELSGALPPELGFLSSLQLLNLESNSLTGEIPDTLGQCSKLLQIKLGGNKLPGYIPGSLGHLSQLQQLSLFSNELHGPIPPELEGLCGSLRHLNLASNYLIRGIPSWLGNCSKLQILLLKSNYLSGGIPHEFGQLGMLQLLDISMNSLIGEIPSSLGNCVQLSTLVLTNPYGCIGSCYVYGGRRTDRTEFNKFNESLPSEITALPKLRVLWAPRAGLSGPIPDTWASCGFLKSINLAENALTGKFPTRLGSCSSLVYLDLSSNSLEGDLPPQLSASCMMVFNVSRNNFSGAVLHSDSKCDGQWIFTSDSGPGEIISPVTCTDLLNANQPLTCGSWRGSSCLGFAPQGVPVIHDLSINRFTGPIPAPLIGESVMQQQPTYCFNLSSNRFTGNFSSSPLFSRCDRFTAFALGLNYNLIIGEIPAAEIGGCRSIVELTASGNEISGGIPQEITTLQNLSVLDLSGNQISGKIPSEIGKLNMLQSLSLADNLLTGKIPEEMGQLSSLCVLDLSGNSLIGEIPGTLGNLSQLQDLMLNNNNLTGKIPQMLAHLSSLISVNFSFNNLTGTIPESGFWKSLCNDSFKGNRYLDSCSPAADSPFYLQTTAQPAPSPETPIVKAASSSSKLGTISIVAITSASATVFVLLVLGLMVHFTRQRLPTTPTGQQRSPRKEVITFTSEEAINSCLTYTKTVRATGNFSLDYLIGNGGFGATYKAELMPGFVVAVKRLSIGRFQGVQQFDAEIRTLGRIRHPNLVTLMGSYSSETEMFLIYNYFPRGNLESFIHNRKQGDIRWQVVHKIALGIGEALAYLHDECVPRILHRDIKPSNILLDNNLTAFLADFGLARLLGASETHATTDVAGTFGYVAPEYAMTCRVSDKADVYSYGVVLLELLSGKKALDPSFSDRGHGFNIVGWASLLIGQRRAHEVFISELWELGPESYLIDTLKLAIMCTVESLTIRPTMRQVVDRLRRIHSSLPFP